ncbi:PI-PLC X domain-containing protein 1 [Eupeodes corollae]|uniref:PI-PLC X domain-containing protein 1 n=1 Tax=Eupeodes corollae TaxID=290404 RepID=UPI002492E2DE|nr:PI-PLC X domain-containing protein 1 [Eupeodes corollae]
MATLAYLLTTVSFINIAVASVDVQLWLSISAQQRQLEVSWANARSHPGDMVLITNQEPLSFEKVKLQMTTETLGDTLEGSGSDAEDIGVVPVAEATPKSLLDVLPLDTSNSAESSSQFYWISNGGMADVVALVRPLQSKQWYTTPVRFDYGLSQNVTAYTKCYGYWASYVDENGTIIASNCMRAYPKWMNEMRSVVSALRVRDLFIPGTHDSGSYRPNFSPSKRETIVTKYALTQDDDIRGQLMHGVRYLDIRVGYYKNTQDLFYVNHGITRQRPLSEVVDQVMDFVLETNEIVIFGVKEFPVGFGKGLGVHRLLVSYLKNRFGQLLVSPDVSWQVFLGDVWKMNQNIFLAYDHGPTQWEFPGILFGPVEQRWGDVRNWARLEKYLIGINEYDRMRLSSRPVADMAELTPDTWGVITDKYGGLRKMADEVNWRITDLYRERLGEHANIVAADFIRGTCLIDIAIELNSKKVIR